MASANFAQKNKARPGSDYCMQSRCPSTQGTKSALDLPQHSQRGSSIAQGLGEDLSLMDGIISRKLASGVEVSLRDG